MEGSMELQSEFHVLSCGCGVGVVGWLLGVVGGWVGVVLVLLPLLIAPPTLPAMSPATVIPTIVEMNIVVS